MTIVIASFITDWQQVSMRNQGIFEVLGKSAGVSKSQESVGAPFNNLNFFVWDHPFSTFARLLYLYMLFLLFHQYFDVYLWFSHRQKSAPSEFFPITFVKHSRTARATDWLVLLYFVNMKLTNFFPIFPCDPRKKLKTLRL